MPKPLKTVKLRLISHRPSSTSVQLNVDRDSGKFWAEHAGQRFEEDTPDAVEQAVIAFLEGTFTVDWQPIIEIHEDGRLLDKHSYQNDPDPPILSFWPARLLVGHWPDGTLKWVRWDADPKYRIAWAHAMEWNPARDGTFAPPCRRGTISPTYYVPYTDERWAALEDLQQLLRGIRQHMGTRFLDPLLRDPAVALDFDMEPTADPVDAPTAA